VDMTHREILLLAFSAAIVTANAYYIHPIIGSVAHTFDVSVGAVGIIPALNQLALALGVLLLLPLGDLVDNRKLVAFCLTSQVLSLVVMALAQDMVVFLTASTLLGFFTITPYLLPAYASRRTGPGRLGFVTAVLTAGVIAGVQVSRLISGVVGEYVDWRGVYWLAAGLMAVAAIALPRIMVKEDRQLGGPSYLGLLATMGKLAFTHRRVMASGSIQGLNFGGFIAIWLGISLHLTSDEMGHGSDLVGYLTAFGAIGLITTASLGRWADRVGAERARVIMALIQFTAITTLALAGAKWWYLLAPLAVMSMVGPLVDVTGRMVALRVAPAVRTRLMSLYIALMFLGGGVGSWSGTLAYERGGWQGSVLLVASISLVVCGLSIREWLWSKQPNAAQV